MPPSVRIPVDPFAPLLGDIAALDSATTAERLDLAGLRAAIAAIAERLRPLVGKLAGELAAADPARAALVRARAAEAPSAPLGSTIPLWGGVTIDEVRANWTMQLRDCAQAAMALARDDHDMWTEWMLHWIEGRAPATTFFRAEHLRDCLREMAKLVTLLAAQPAVRTLKTGSRLADDVASPATWEVAGTGSVLAGDKGVAIDGSGCAAWLRPELGSVAISCNWRPERIDGTGAGAFLMLSARPLADGGWSAATGPLEDLAYGFDSYLCSLCRGLSEPARLRRSGRGWRLCARARPGDDGADGRGHRVEAVLVPGWVQVLVDGKLEFHYPDAGTYGPPPSGGRFGIRLFNKHGMRLGLAGLDVRTVA